MARDVTRATRRLAEAGFNINRDETHRSFRVFFLAPRPCHPNPCLMVTAAQFLNKKEDPRYMSDVGRGDLEMDLLRS